MPIVTSARSTSSAAGCTYRRRGAEGQELRDPAQHHHALHADHERRQGARPRTLLRPDQGCGDQGGAQGAPPRRQGCDNDKDVVLDNLDDAIAAVSGEEGYRFNARQLFYFLRPIVMDETGKELKIGNFTGIINDYENEHGEIPRMYREPRRLDHPSAPGRDHHAGHADGRGVRAPGVDLQQAGLHREGRRAGSAEAEPLAGAARLRA